MKPRLIPAALLLTVLLFAPIPVGAWELLERFRGDVLYMAYDIVYRVTVTASGVSGVATSSYTLHIFIERLNGTHYIASASASDVVYSFASDDVIFLHAFVSLYMVNLSRYFIELLYVPRTKGVTLDVVLPKESVPLFLNSVARWYRIVEGTTGEVCQEIRVGNVTVGSGVRYRMVSPRAELVYDCPSGILVSMTASVPVEAAGASVTMSVELSKLNFLNLTSIRLPRAEVSREPALAVPVALLVFTAAVLATVVVLTLVIVRRLKRLLATHGAPVAVGRALLSAKWRREP